MRFVKGHLVAAAAMVVSTTVPASAAPTVAGQTQEDVLARCRRNKERCAIVIGEGDRSTSPQFTALSGSGKQPDDYRWYYDRDEPYAICEGKDCYYRGTLHIHYGQSLNGYQMRYWQSIESDYEVQDPFRILANHVQCRRDQPRDSNCDESPNPPPARDWHTHLRQPDRFTLDAYDGHDGKKFLNLAHELELDIEGLPTVNVTGTDTSYRWQCDGDRVDKCRYDGPD